MEDYQAQLKRLRGRLNNPTYEPNINRIQKKINYVRKQAGLDPRSWNNWTPKYQRNQATAPAVNTDAATNQDQVSDYWKMLLPNQSTYESHESSPLYKWQESEANRQADMWESRAGLGGSTAAANVRNRILQELRANEAERAQGVGEQHADRLWNILSTEAQMNQASSDSQWGRVMDLMNWISEQNPIRYTYGAQGDTANIQADQSAKMAQIMAQIYGQAYPLVENAVPPFLAPYPASPDYSGANISAASRAPNNAGSNILNSLVGYFLTRK